MPFAPHCVVSPIGTMASAHVCATVPNFLACEWHWINHPDYWKGWVKEGEIIEKGHVTLSDRAGHRCGDERRGREEGADSGTTWFEANA